jgi:hypothetical protein
LALAYGGENAAVRLIPYNPSDLTQIWSVGNFVKRDPATYYFASLGAVPHSSQWVAVSGGPPNNGVGVVTWAGQSPISDNFYWWMQKSGEVPGPRLPLPVIITKDLGRVVS